MNTTEDHGHGNKVIRVLKHEIAAMLPSLVFFLLGFNLIVICLNLALEPYGATAGSAVKATVGALVIAKVVLIVDHLPFASRFSGRPLIRPVLYRSLLYALFTLLVHELEAIIRAWVKEGAFSAGLATWSDAFVWPHFLFVTIWVSSLFLVFVTFDEIRRAYRLPMLPRMLWARNEQR